MSNTYIQRSEDPTYVAPGGGVTVNIPVIIGQQFIIPKTTEAATALFSGYTEGIHDLPKQAALAIAAGVLVYWDTGAAECDTTATNVRIGTCTIAAAPGDTTVRVKLDGAPLDVVNDEVDLNSTHRTGDGSDHADVATNSVHVAGDGSDHADVATNTAAHAAMRTATITAGAEAVNVIPITISVEDLAAAAQNEALQFMVRVYDATGDLDAAAFVLTDITGGGDGTRQGPASSAAALYTSAAGNGDIDIDVTDVLGASGSTVTVEATPVGAVGQPAYLAISFD